MIYKRKIIIRDIDSNIEYDGFIKRCHSDEDGDLGYFIITDCSWFEGHNCRVKEKEGFKYSWIHTTEGTDIFNKVNLGNMKTFDSDDWAYDLPYDDSQNREWFEFLCIELVNLKPKNNFRKIKI